MSVPVIEKIFDRLFGVEEPYLIISKNSIKEGSIEDEIIKEGILRGNIILEKRREMQRLAFEF